ANYKPHTNCDLKIIIKGTSGELKGIMKNPIIDEWKNSGFKIIYKNLPPNYNEQSTNKIRDKFSHALYRNISHDPQLIQSYHKIIGIPDLKLSHNVKITETNVRSETLLTVPHNKIASVPQNNKTTI